MGTRERCSLKIQSFHSRLSSLVTNFFVFVYLKLWVLLLHLDWVVPNKKFEKIKPIIKI